ncbi:MAG TPA: hypothetical protein VFF49_04675 [Thermodesulfobacteriota bacterium]|nr:hypothetical protein [Thermodesulfobacteriota bacterium]
MRKRTQKTVTSQTLSQLESYLQEGWSFSVAMAKIGICPNITEKVRSQKEIEDLRLKYCTPGSTLHIRRRNLK